MMFSKPDWRNYVQINIYLSNKISTQVNVTKTTENQESD